MIRERITGREIATEVLPASAADIRPIGRGRRFDWRSTVEDSEAYKLVSIEDPGMILGLIALKRAIGFVEVVNLEVTPSSVGAGKRYERVAGNLLASSVRLSFSLGNAGFLRLIARTSLIEHYRTTYGFSRQGHSQVMILETGAATRALEAYFEGVD